MAASTALISLPGLLLIHLFIPHGIAAQTDTLNANQTIRDGHTLVSSFGKFVLGFFSPGKSNNRYVGVWFNNKSETAVVWVANREAPLADNSGVLKLIHPGILILLNATNATVWASNAATTTTVKTPVAQLLDSGNLVIRDSGDGSPEKFLWQSFDIPTDTFLPGMVLGWNLVTGTEFYLTSWKSYDDPSRGEFSYGLDLTGYPQMVIKKGSAFQNRLGPWNGIRFPGITRPMGDNGVGNTVINTLTFVMNAEEVYYITKYVNRSSVTRYSLNQRGVMQRWSWVEQTRGWVIDFSIPSDICDTYKLCGAYGMCDLASSPSCGCLDRRFVPRDPEGWARTDWSSGCVRRSNLSCNGDAFVMYSGIKLPDARNSWHDGKMGLEECRVECLRNCSCMAYTQLDVKNKSGCLIWYDELVDIRTVSKDGQFIYIRVAASEAESDEGGDKRKIYLIATLVPVVGSVVLVVVISVCMWKRKNVKMVKEEENCIAGDEKNSDLAFWDLSVILKATNHFSINNMLGEGGFGAVYKGMLEGGQEIAVKRLSKESRQGMNELKNEMIFIAKLRHRNLVKLLGCCIKGNESILVYEYLPNKSLDLILFDETISTLLDWEKRFRIINGIARGLMYLHQDSPLRIIHRDLKASNILLDSEMNPKISDFGLARSFGGDETEAHTHRVVGTYGYMSPEYAVDGVFSVKSDVFSFGVLVLEIVSGKRNRGFSHSDHGHNLLGHAWILYKEGRPFELVDTSVKGRFESAEVEKWIGVGLLCVQQNPEDRPNMSNVVWMLGNECEIPEAKHPGFFMERDVAAALHSSGSDATITVLEPR